MATIMQRLFAVAFSLLLAWALVAQESGTTVSAPEVGFRLTIPDVGWTHRTEQDSEGLTAIALGPAELGGYVQLSVQVSVVVDSRVEAIHAQLAQLRAAIAGEAGISEVEELEFEVAGEKAIGLRVVQEALGQVFRVHLVFLRDRGFEYRIQFHAPRDSFDEHWATAKRVLSGFELIKLSEEAKGQVRLRELAERCGSQVNWTSSWDDAARQAREEGRLVVVAVHALPGFQIGNQLNESVFMSPEVLGLLKHRFIAWRWSSGQEAPFVDREVFGLSGTTFGMGLLVCDSDGRVLRQVFLLEPALVADALRETLSDHPELAPPPSPSDETQAEQAAFLIDSGQIESARKVLGHLASPESRRTAFQRARLHRVERDGSGSLEWLAKARSLRPSSPLDPSDAALLLEEAGVWMSLGDNDAAKDALADCLSNSPDDSVRAEAVLLQGLLSWAVEDDRESTREQWLAIARGFPDQPAAWIAAAALLGPALEMEIQPDLTWPTAAASLMSIIPAPAPGGSILDVPAVLTAALDWLISVQRGDGAWDTPSGVRNTQPGPDPITMASQAIIIRVLARAASESHKSDVPRAARYREAALLGLRRYMANRDLLRERPRTVAFMDYTCWSSSYGLFALTAFLSPELGITSLLEPAEVAAMELEAGQLVEDLIQVQHVNGGWSYYISGTAGGTDAGAAMSFTTATVLLALQGAVDWGIDVPPNELARGYDCLASLYGTNGNFEYMRRGGGAFRAGAVHPAGSAARGPVCTRAMMEGGRVDADAMQHAFDTYVEHLPPFGAEARKALMHAGDAAQGSHYLLYDYSTAAEALRAMGPETLEETTRRQARSAILRELSRCRSEDGSFVDNPLIGAAAGTGLAASTLLDLVAASPPSSR